MAIVEGQWRDVALRDEEYVLILRQLGREPSVVELGMFGAMWSEHCGYKHSRPHLTQLPTTAPWVVQGPGENAGAVSIGDGLAAVFKVESHNHPSAVEPYQGAATGVGGIVRDIFTMNARPVALLDSLRFGPLTQHRNRYLFEHVVAGIGGYGNCLGIPTVAGDVFFDQSYVGNPIVNAMCVGIAREDRLMRARASGIGNVVVLVGAETGRDGLHGATFASVEDPEASHRGVIQVGNPFLEKQLMEACLELLHGDDVVAMQDLGAAGLTSSLVECASRGDVGADIDVALVPTREKGMTAYEVMLSESQERMLLVASPDRLPKIEATLGRWSLKASAIGTITDDGRVRVRSGAEIVADVPVRLFTDGCPTYEVPALESADVATARAETLDEIRDLSGDQLLDALVSLLGSPNVGSRRSIFEQFDHTILTNTLVAPGEGDAAVLRIKGTSRAIAVSIDCNPRYCYLDPYEGTRHAVAEATRNLSCVGGRPLGVTNCLNFGNPERPGVAWQLQEAVRGLADACRELKTPVVSGNVSLYNETAESAIMPTPVVGCVGVVENAHRYATMRWCDGDDVLLVGTGLPTLGGSEYLARKYGRISGSVPSLDLTAESQMQRLVQLLIAEGITKTAHDCGIGGLAVALAEMSIASRLGVVVNADFSKTQRERLDCFWFGEAGSRILISLAPANSAHVVELGESWGVPVTLVGHVRGNVFDVGNNRVVSVKALCEASDAALTAVNDKGPNSGRLVTT